MTWTNADGTTDTIVFADNAEAYRPGSPIFAWSGTIISPARAPPDLFVFSQPIGNDVIHSFDVAADKIDLIGYGFNSAAALGLLPGAGTLYFVTLPASEKLERRHALRTRFYMLAPLAAFGWMTGFSSAQNILLRANTVRELVQELRVCWQPPRQNARTGMQITVRLSFTRSGAVLGAPRITYETAEASDQQRLAYRMAVAEMLLRCTPVAITEGLGDAIAGRPITIRLEDSRGPRPNRRRFTI
jgi:hypothetical protein